MKNSIYIVQGLHPSTPGKPMTAHRALPDAAREARSLVEIIGDHLVEMDERPDAAASWTIALSNDWETALAYLKDRYEACDHEGEFDVWIEELEVPPSATYLEVSLYGFKRDAEGNTTALEGGDDDQLAGFGVYVMERVRDDDSIAEDELGQGIGDVFDMDFPDYASADRLAGYLQSLINPAGEVNVYSMPNNRDYLQAPLIDPVMARHTLTDVRDWLEGKGCIDGVFFDEASLLARVNETLGDGPAAAPLPQYNECGTCGHYHRPEFRGDCRDDSERWTLQELEELHGKFGFMWKDLNDPADVAASREEGSN